MEEHSRASPRQTALEASPAHDARRSSGPEAARIRSAGRLARVGWLLRSPAENSGAQLYEPLLDAISSLGIVDPFRNGRRTRPEAGSLSMSAERRRTVRRALEVLERTLEVAAAGPVEGKAFELIVE